MVKKLVIAGNSQQAIHWVKTECQRRWDTGDTSVSLSDYIVVDGPTNIRGISNPHGVFVGTWKERRDIIEIVTILLMCTHPNNPTLQKVYDDLAIGAT